ncbi:glycosyltransferase family 4 protein [candidate division KSB1 bacterium]|nr:glycosyltransferase family 4 protein [candidate division KSB1 bacterium]
MQWTNKNIDEVKRREKNILMVLQSDYPPDIRLTKEINALSKAGYSVYLLCNNLAGRIRLEELDGATILRLRHYRSLPTRLINVPLFFNPSWLYHIRKAIKQYNIAFVHVHDLPLAMAAIWMAKLYNLPAIFDVHENYPAALRIWGHKGMFWFIFRNPRLAEKLERMALKRADAILTVAEEHRRLFTSWGLPPEKIICVANTVDYQSYLRMKLDRQIVKTYENQYVIEYLGKFGPERDLETAIRALKILRQDIATIKLLLVGDGPNREQLLQYAQKEGVADLVEITGWVDFDLTPSYIQASDVCIVPQPSNALIDHGVPHKIFQYMAYSKPVVSSDAKALMRVVKDSQCGEIFRSGSSEELARAVLKIYRSDFPYGANGYKAIKEKYNWTQSSKELLRAYSFCENAAGRGNGRVNEK